VPKSNVRKKKVYTPPTELRPASPTTSRKPSPVWVPAVSVGLIVAGIGWLVVFYLSQGLYPVYPWRFWNLAVGFGAIVAASGILARWR
jgi:Cell division protein CrgA